MNTESWSLTKFDAAERQLNQAIRLFFSEGDEIAIHTLAEAAAQILYDIRHLHGGGTSLIRDSELVRPEKKREWLFYMHRSRNFFKHADRDPEELHEFKAVFNHFSLLDAVNLYLSAKRAWTPETMVFFSWFLAAHPNLVNRDDPQFASFFEKNLEGPDGIDHTNLSTFSQVIAELRGGLAMPGITLISGLPKTTP